MNLRVYLATKNIQIKDFSDILECNRSYLSRIISGHIKPSKRLAKEIERMTNGDVTAAELLANSPESPKNEPNELSSPTPPTSTPKGYPLEGSIFDDK